MKARLLLLLVFLLGATILIGGSRAAVSSQRYIPVGSWSPMGPDGGDMHFVYVTRKHVLFASHGFGGVWRSVDRGASWSLVWNPEFIDTNFQAMAEVDDLIIAGGNNGLWVSRDDGETWERLVTGDSLIDSWGNYEVVSIIPFSQNHILFSVKVDRGAAREDRVQPRHGFFELHDGDLSFHPLPEGGSVNVVVMLGYDGEFGGRRLLFVASSEAGLYSYDLDSGSWEKLLDGRVTRVYVDGENRKVYVGTIGDWYYIGVYDGGWSWEHVTVPGKKCAVASFIRPDPYNPDKLWIGAVGTSRGVYPLPRDVEEGDSFIGVGFRFSGSWVGLNLTGNWATMVAIDVHGPGEDMKDYTIQTMYGRVARYAYVPQGGRGNIKKTEDGGNTWRRSYNGIYGDTINMVTYLSSGVRAGDLVVTCVSGNQIAKNLGEYWEEGVDFTIGNLGGGLPGYSWGAASPEEPLNGRYDLLIATGYPPEHFTGNGIYAIDTECLKTGRGRCIERLTDKPAHEILVVDAKLYIGRMDEGVDILDLNTMTITPLEGLPDGEAGLNLLYSDGKLFVATEKGGNRNTDNYFFADPRSRGGLYVCSESCTPIYVGDRVVDFSVKDRELIMLTNHHKLIYMADYSSGEPVEVELPEDVYSGMAVDWTHGVIYLSTFNVKTPAVYYAYIDDLKAGRIELHQFTKNLLTNWGRNIILVQNTLFLGTEGQSVWRAKITYQTKQTTTTTPPETTAQPTTTTPETTATTPTAIRTTTTTTQPVHQTTSEKTTTAVTTQQKPPKPTKPSKPRRPIDNLVLITIAVAIAAILVALIFIVAKR